MQALETKYGIGSQMSSVKQESSEEEEDEIYDGPIEGEPEGEDESDEAEVDLQSFTHQDVIENPNKLVEKIEDKYKTMIQKVVEI